MATYQDQNLAQKYLDFLNSQNGQIQQKVLLGAISSRLPKNRELRVLDAACGPGWLSGELKKVYDVVAACDASEFFIQFSQSHYPGINFKFTTLDKPLPYQNNFFDIVILNMAAPDLNNLANVFKNLELVLKPSGKLIMTIPNPEFSYPAAEWKKSLLDVLLGRKPKLITKTPPLSGKKIQREFGKNVKIDSYFYSLADYKKAAQAAGFTLKFEQEIKSATDSQEFNLTYQLYRYPLFLLLEFAKEP